MASTIVLVFCFFCLTYILLPLFPYVSTVLSSVFPSIHHTIQDIQLISWCRKIIHSQQTNPICHFSPLLKREICKVVVDTWECVLLGLWSLECLIAIIGKFARSKYKTRGLMGHLSNNNPKKKKKRWSWHRWTALRSISRPKVSSALRLSQS